MDDMDVGGDWEDDDDFGFGDEDETPAPAPKTDSISDFPDSGGNLSGFSLPESGRPPAACWSVNSSHAAVHIAGGGASSALQLLNRQIAVSDFSKLRNAMIGCYLGSLTS